MITFDDTIKIDTLIHILTFIADQQREFGSSPSIRQICAEFHYGSTSVGNYWLDQVEKAGLIERLHGRARGIRITEYGQQTLARNYALEIDA